MLLRKTFLKNHKRGAAVVVDIFMKKLSSSSISTYIIPMLELLVSPKASSTEPGFWLFLSSVCQLYFADRQNNLAEEGPTLRYALKTLCEPNHTQSFICNCVYLFKLEIPIIISFIYPSYLSHDKIINKITFSDTFNTSAYQFT